MHVVICGGGVIGAASAYCLAARGARVTVIERTGIACAASGKSGGFLALDWCDGTPLEELARRSFALHEEWAASLGEDWGYRRLETFGGSLGRSGRAGRETEGWLSGNVRLAQQLGDDRSTAQVHPGAFTQGLMRAAEAQGAELRPGEVTGLVRDNGNGPVHGVLLGDEVVEADAVVIAMGPWSILATEWLPLPPVYGLKGHSIVFRTGEAVPPQALFLEYREADGTGLSPEVFPRADGTTYVCAVSSDAPLPVDPGVVGFDPGAIERLEDLCRRLSPVLADAEILARQACHRPVTRDGLPLIGAVPGAPGAFVATGHSVWGILNAPATGEAVAELILDGATRRVDLERFDPSRLRPLKAG